MDSNVDYVELVKKAQLGDEEDLSRLAEAAHGRLRSFVMRLGLGHDVAEDVLQESLLEMAKLFGELRKADRFWPWLYSIALKKTQRYYRQQGYKMTAIPSANLDERAGEDRQGGLGNLISQELKQAVVAAMEGLKPRHKAVLAMRCYDEMEYPMIAKALGCSEFGARMLFYRAKNALQKQLARNGFGKGSLLMALTVFGKMTAADGAVAAGLSVKAATTKVGVSAGLVGLAGSKAAVTTLTTAGVLTVGVMVASPGMDAKIDSVFGDRSANKIISVSAEVKKGDCQEWFYFPEGSDGPVMMQLMKVDSPAGQFQCQWLQNDYANYSRYGNTVHITNHRIWQKDLSVYQLPTDEPELRGFLSEVQGDGANESMGYVSDRNDGLLVIADTCLSKNSNRLQVLQQQNVLYEDYFRCDWPSGRVKIVDKRDSMHRRGWTHFKISGEINGREFSAVGRIPFVYDVYHEYRPWARIELDGKKIYEGYNVPQGLGRPWMGLHTIDSVRRDAARQKVRFETELIDTNKAEVTLTEQQIKLIYTIDMYTDLIEQIRFFENDKQTGILTFSYPQENEDVGADFVEPRRIYKEQLRDIHGMLWLMRIADGKL